MPTHDRVAPTKHAPPRGTPVREEDAYQRDVWQPPRDVKTILGLQRTVGNRAVSRLIQRHCYEQFTSYSEAKNHNQYSMALLDKQMNDPINLYEQQPFSATERENILAVNKANSGRGEIVSDEDPSKVLKKQDLAKTPHVDHRYPKSKGGSNSFANARVISAEENLKKSANTGKMTKEPTTALPQYAALDDSKYKIFSHAGFSTEQRNEIYLANELHYGSLTSDSSGDDLRGADSSEVPHIDHVLSKSGGGCSFYFNAAVLPADENISKSGRRWKIGEERDDGDYATGVKSLAEYFEDLEKTPPKKHKGGGKITEKKHIGGRRHKPFG